jgi:hypothetical protein
MSVARVFGAGDPLFDECFPPCADPRNATFERQRVGDAAALWCDDAGCLVAALAARDAAGSVRLVRLTPHADVTVALLRTLTPHTRRPGRGRADEEAHVFDVRVWAPVADDRTRDALVTAGIDGRVVVSPLGARAAPARSWDATGTNQTPCHRAAVCDRLGVVFTASQFENAGSFWELATGRRLRRVAPLGAEMRRGKFTVMCAEFSEKGVLAFTSSNDCDAATLHLISPSDDDAEATTVQAAAGELPL